MLLFCLQARKGHPFWITNIGKYLNNILQHIFQPPLPLIWVLSEQRRWLEWEAKQYITFYETHGETIITSLLRERLGLVTLSVFFFFSVSTSVSVSLTSCSFSILRLSNFWTTKTNVRWQLKPLSKITRRKDCFLFVYLPYF